MLTSKWLVRSGTAGAPVIGANVRSGGTQLPATIDGTNSSAPECHRAARHAEAERAAIRSGRWSSARAG